jgi:Uncharacterised ACR, YagE family COG1723
MEIEKVISNVNSTKYMVEPLTDDEMEQDTFSVVIGAGNGSIANDTITLPQVYYSEWRIKMAISHALAQSSKLCVYEERMNELVTSTKDMPLHLAKTGKVCSDPSATDLPKQAVRVSDRRRIIGGTSDCDCTPACGCHTFGNNDITCTVHTQWHCAEGKLVAVPTCSTFDATFHTCVYLCGRCWQMCPIHTRACRQCYIWNSTICSCRGEQLMHVLRPCTQLGWSP